MTKRRHSSRNRIQKTLAQPLPLTSLGAHHGPDGAGGWRIDRRGRRLLGCTDGGFSTACWVPGTSAHSWQAVAAGGTTIGRKGMILATRVLAATGWDLFQSPDLLAPPGPSIVGACAGRSYQSLLGAGPEAAAGLSQMHPRQHGR